MTMAVLVFSGWRPGLRKISLTNLLHSRATIPLAAAKQHVDDILDGQEVRISLADLDTAAGIARAANALGAVVALEPEDRRTTAETESEHRRRR